MKLVVTLHTTLADTGEECTTKVLTVDGGDEILPLLWRLQELTPVTPASKRQFGHLQGALDQQRRAMETASPLASPLGGILGGIGGGPFGGGRNA